MLYGEFRELVKDTLARGDEPETPLYEENSGSTTTVLDRMIRMALHQIERQWDWKYMERLAEFSVEEGQQRIGLPANLKRIEWIRLTENEQFYYLRQMYGRDFPKPYKGVPQEYWLEGRAQLHLDVKADRDYEGQLLYTRYSDMSFDPESTNWVMDYAPDVLLARTMMNFAGWVREDTQIIYEHWNAMFQRNLEEMFNEDSRYSEANPTTQIGFADARSEYQKGY